MQVTHNAVYITVLTSVPLLAYNAAGETWYTRGQDSDYKEKPTAVVVNLFLSQLVSTFINSHSQNFPSLWHYTGNFPLLEFIMFSVWYIVHGSLSKDWMSSRYWTESTGMSNWATSVRLPPTGDMSHWQDMYKETVHGSKQLSGTSSDLVHLSWWHDSVEWRPWSIPYNEMRTSMLQQSFFNHVKLINLWNVAPSV